MVAVTVAVGRGDNATGTSSSLAARLVAAVSAMDETDAPARPCAASVLRMATPATLPPTVSASVAPRASAGAVMAGGSAAAPGDGAAAAPGDGVAVGRARAGRRCCHRQNAA